MSRKSEIMDAIVARLNTLVTSSDIAVVNFEVIKLVFSDFEDWELPAVQIIDQGEVVFHERGRVRKEWNIVLELVMKSSETKEIRQKDLFDLQNLIEITLWEFPNLKIPGVIDMKYEGSQTDLHMVTPFYYTRMELTVRYYDALVSAC